MATSDIIQKCLGFIAAAAHTNKLISAKLSKTPQFYKTATHIVQHMFAMGLVIAFPQRA